MGEDAVLICCAGHVLCDLGIVAVYENTRVRALSGKKVGRPEDSGEPVLATSRVCRGHITLPGLKPCRSGRLVLPPPKRAA